MKQEQYIIEGMSCLSCKKTIEKGLRQVEGVQKASIDYSSKQLKIKYQESLVDEMMLKVVVQELGYQLFTPEEVKSNKQLIGLSIVLVVFAYLLFERVMPDFSSVLTSNQGVSFMLLFIVGITTSFHCVSMCGGIALSQFMSSEKKSTSTPGVWANVTYNLGRVISYTLLGGVVGALGSFMTIDFVLFNWLPVLLGIIMILIGLNKVGFLSLKQTLFSRNLNVLFGRMKSKIGRRGPMVMGLVNGFMPCGPLQLMQLYALGTGSFVQGALAMFFFSLGTVPLMLGLGLFLSKMSAYSRSFVYKIGGALVIVLGLNMTISGMATLGINPTLSTDSTTRVEASIVDGVQVVEFDLERRNYEDIVVKKGIPVKLVINTNQGTLNGCNRSLILKDFGIEQDLTLGENEITFTPSNTGTYTYSCWMGMIRNSIKVID